jgi:hypothetical protein
MKVAEVEGAVGVVRKGRKEGKERAMGDAMFLYPAKAAAGPCARLARCGGCGFRMRACCLVIYFFKKKET